MTHLAVLLCLAMAGCASDDGSVTCSVRDIAELPVLNRGGSPVVKAAINGRPVAFVVDTGAFLAVLGKDDAAALDVPTRFGNRYLISGIGGSAFASNATVRELSLDTAIARNVDIQADTIR